MCNNSWRTSSGHLLLFLLENFERASEHMCNGRLGIVTGLAAGGNTCGIAWASYSSTLLVSLTLV